MKLINVRNLNVKMGMLIFFLVFVLTVAFTVFSKNGFLHLFKLKQELLRIEKSNHELNVENHELFNKIRKLSRSKSAQEEAIRRELGWVKNGEIVVEFFLSPPGELKKSDATFPEKGEVVEKPHTIEAK